MASDQESRERALADFRKGTIRFLITTNVASRGLGILSSIRILSTLVKRRYSEGYACDQLWLAKQYPPTSQFYKDG